MKSSSDAVAADTGHRAQPPVHRQAPRETRPGLAATVIGWLATVKVAVSIVILITIACIVGTLLPQEAEVAQYLQLHPEAAPKFEWLSRFGLTHIFSCWWFIGLLTLLAASMAACSSRRFNTVRRTKGLIRQRAFGSMITHISMLLILLGAIIRGTWGERGVLELIQGEPKDSFLLENGTRSLPFTIRLNKFELEADAPAGDTIQHLMVEWPAENISVQLPVKVDEEQVVSSKTDAKKSYSLKIVRYVPDFTIDSSKQIVSKSDEPNNPAIQVAIKGPNFENKRWLFAKFPDFGHEVTADMPLKLSYQHSGAAEEMPRSIKNFKSTLSIIDGGKEIREQVVRVNSPFSYKGYSFFQSGYNPRDFRWTSLQVVRDPGVPVVYAGFLLMIVGLAIAFYAGSKMDAARSKT